MRALVVGFDEAGSNPGRESTRALRTGFTLIDIMVTIAVIGVLIAIMLPSLASVRETAHQVVCRSNIRQIGFGVEMYAESNKRTVPYSSVGEYQAFDTITLRFGQDWTGAQIGYGWDGLGWLYEGDYLPAAKIFYCPSHSGRHRFADTSEQWRTDSLTIVGNYQYRGRGPDGGITSGTPRMTTKLDQIKPSAALVADGLRTTEDFNHQVGANLLRADLSADWFSDSDRSLVDMIPKDGQALSTTTMLNLWAQLDYLELR